MNSRDVIKRLRNDVGVIDVPPIPQAVRQAVREQREKYIAYYGQAPEMKKSTRDMVVKGIFAAMVTAMVVSVPIIVVMTNHAPVSDLPDTSVLPNSSGTVSAAESQIVTSTEQSETTLERIKLKQIYGEVALSGKSEEELETLLVTYTTKDSVYEDDRYIYNFDSQGRLIEMRKAAFGDEEGQPVDELAISAKVNALLKEYYPDWIENGCDIKIEKNEDRRPAWKVYVTQSTDSFTKNILTVTFDKSGLLHGIVLDGSAKNMGIISKAEAVEIVLQELRSGRYKLPEFENEDVEITVNIKAIDNKQYYEVNVDKIPYEIVNDEINFAGFIFLVDTDTGKCSLFAHDP